MTSTPFIREIPNLVTQLGREVIIGDFAEVGVLAGRTFIHLVRSSQELGRVAHAFDSFTGMAIPGPFDGDQYPEGRFDMGGVKGFQKHFEAVHLVTPDKYRVWPGFIPECFAQFQATNPRQKFSLVLIDVDHYEPTLLALNFMAERISPGGFLVLDDYLPAINGGMLATRAIDEWLAEPRPFAVLRHEGGQLFLRRCL